MLTDLLVGGVLIPRAEAPKLITKEMIKTMKRGSVIVDVAIDQGGCEPGEPTTHKDPTYIVDDVVHYCVAICRWSSRTSTFALNQATLPYLVNLNKVSALGEDKFSRLIYVKGKVSGSCSRFI